MRLLLNKKNDAALNMAIDEAILMNQKPDLRPTLRFYDWSSISFSFGYFQRICEEVNLINIVCPWTRHFQTFVLLILQGMM